MYHYWQKILDIFAASPKLISWRVNFSLVSFRHSEEVCGTGAFVFAGVILFPFLFKSFYCGGYAIFSNFLEFWQLSFDLSIKSTHEIKRSKVIQWNGTEEFWEKLKVFGTEWRMVFFTGWLLPDIPLIRLDAFLHLV